MLIITTLGRSGSSIVARICGELGYPSGGAWSGRSNAGLEDEHSMNVNTDILRHLDCPAKWPMPINYKQTMDLVENDARFVRDGNRVLKDPRFIDRRIMELWLEHIKTPTVLLLHRDFEKIYQSRAVYNVPGNRRAYRDLFAEFITLLLERDLKYRLLLFPKYIEEPEQLLEALQYLGLKFDWKQGLEITKKILDPKMVHF